MRIALTFNLRRSASEDEAEFDSPETIVMLRRMLETLGHDVISIDVSGPVETLIARLRRAAPDVVFNLAEGRRGPFREGLYPALFEEIGLRHTGSSASVLALCLDKMLAKRVVAAAGVRVPRSRLVLSASDVGPMTPPVIVKPNFEGSSKGITQASVALERATARKLALRTLERYPDGVLVEQYVDGIDVSVGWVERFGFLPPIEYVYTPSGPHRILDFALKRDPARIDVRVSPLDAEVHRALLRSASRAFDALGVMGYGRADFRITPRGEVFFLEMNPLPSLAAEDSELWEAMTNIGRSRTDLVDAIVAAARGARQSPARPFAPRPSATA